MYGQRLVRGVVCERFVTRARRCSQPGLMNSPLPQTWTSSRWCSRLTSTSLVRSLTLPGSATAVLTHARRLAFPYVSPEQRVHLEDFFKSVRGRLRTDQVKSWMEVLERQRNTPSFSPPTRAPSHAVRAASVAAKATATAPARIGGSAGLLAAGFALGVAVTAAVLRWK